jgi:FAD/FMN-containing dehydrogenase
MRARRVIAVLLLTTVLAVGGPPAIFLTNVWWHDSAVALQPPSPGTDDASHLNSNRPAEVIAVANDPAVAEQQLTELVKRASAEHLHLSISGARHSMGGHTIYPGGIVLDMLSFNRMSLDESTRILTVGAGAVWSAIIPFLDGRGYSVLVMQTNNDFSVGGSISVNCHGWQNNAPPIASTVESFRILTPSGQIENCSRTENQELFALALGGYGLFGVILDVKLHVVPNEYYAAEARRVTPGDYNRVYHDLTNRALDVGMAYGRVNVAPHDFFTDGIVTVLKRRRTDLPITGTLTKRQPSVLKRLVFRGGIGSDYGKNLRWWLETTFGETGGKLLSRNQILQEPSDLYASRDPNLTDILQEYFVPVGRMGEFVESARPVFLKHHPDLLNVTVRNVEPDPDSFLRYATEEVFGLVMLFSQRRDAEADRAMQGLTRELIDVALSCGGRYYLPYRLHATQAQFERAYPQGREFFAKKRKYDPNGIFENQFSLKFGSPSSADKASLPVTQPNE